ncbi:MAG TPA: AAA family ATPase [Gaiellaceae bacterium]|jgi:DNA-binding CsgD family transcriptional regulator
MLLGREAECRRIDRLLAEARKGASGALVVRGEPGIGKTALLRYACRRATDMTVLQARGVESESELPFAGLADLVRLVLDFLRKIPAPQSAALAGALAIGPPGAGDLYAVAAATLSLLAAAAESNPLLAVVDDAHWLDASSSTALVFAARRLGAEGVVLLFAVREGERTGFEPAGLPELTLSGLGRDASRELLAGAEARPVAADVAERLFEVTGGNPLAMIEIPGALSDGELAGREPLEDPLPPGARIERAFRRRLAELPAESRRTLLLAAASETPDLDTIATAAKALRLDPKALEPAEAAGLIAIEGGRLEWRHPLLRSAVYHGASAGERRAAHRALADALAGARSADRRAWHLASAALAPDEAVAQALEQAALDARRRGARATAAGAYERATRLTPDDEQRSRRLLEAARDWQLVGRLDRALTLLDDALARTSNPLIRADIQHLRGSAEMWTGSAEKSQTLLEREAKRVEPLDPGRAARMLGEASIAWTMAGECRKALSTARHACRVAERAGPGAREVTAGLLSNALILRGDAHRAHPLLVRCRSAFEEGDPLAMGGFYVQAAGHSSVWIEEYAEGRAVLVRTIEAAREASALGLLPFPLAALAELDFRTGRWAAAYANASESVALAEELRQLNELSFSLVSLALVEAGQGRQEETRAHVARAVELAGAYGVGSILAYAGSALGLLELGLGRPEEAIAHLERVDGLVRGFELEEPGVVQWAPDLVEAYILARRAADAERILSAFQRQAKRTGRTWALATAARCRGMLADEDGFETEFGQALSWHERTKTPFERARTELRLGERLRRARRASDARARLRSALEAFEALGATPWAEQARVELAASGERRERRREASGLRRLTPQELQIALIAARGATNREIAAGLFLSPKTVEFHLGKVYRKLGIRSRTELAHALAEERISAGAT